MTLFSRSAIGKKMLSFRAATLLSVTAMSMLCSYFTTLQLFHVAGAERSPQPQQQPQQRQVPLSIQIMNESGEGIEVHWIHPETHDLHRVSSPRVFDGQSLQLNSYVGHSFEVREAPAPSGDCSVGEAEIASSGDEVISSSCRAVHFEVNNTNDNIFVIQRGISLRRTPTPSPFVSTAKKESKGAMTISDCQEQAQERARQQHGKQGNIPVEDAQETMNLLLECIQRSISGDMERVREEIKFHSSVRKDMGALLEDYTCSDNSLPSSPAKKVLEWINARSGVTHQVSVLHEHIASKVHKLSNFISDEECRAVEEAANPILHRATVADGAGGSQLSDSRRAMQAGVKIPWDKEAEGHPLAALSRRVYDYANHVLGLDIEEFGQEDLMSIQYFGRGDNDTAPDRYMPHCDGDCGGLPFKPGNRMSTMVMYCGIPKRGGATNFRNAGLHVVPEKGAATFFSYINPETMLMDKGFTEHSGCPVVEGDKKIAVQWIRMGVDKENPWDSFNTLGIKKADADSQ